MSVLRFERYPVAPDSVDAFDAAVASLVEAMRTSEGNLWADAGAATDDQPSRLVLSEWRSASDEQAWASGAEAKRFTDEADVMLRGEPTMRRFASA